MAQKITDPQAHMLVFYLEVERKTPRPERVARTKHNPIVMNSLFDKKLLDRVGWKYSSGGSVAPDIQLTEAGRVEAENALTRLKAARDARRAKIVKPAEPKCPTSYTLSAHEGGLCNCPSQGPNFPRV